MEKIENTHDELEGTGSRDDLIIVDDPVGHLKDKENRDILRIFEKLANDLTNNNVRADDISMCFDIKNLVDCIDLKNKKAQLPVEIGDYACLKVDADYVICGLIDKIDTRVYQDAKKEAFVKIKIIDKHEHEHEIISMPTTILEICITVNSRGCELIIVYTTYFENDPMKYLRRYNDVPITEIPDELIMLYISRPLGVKK